LSRESHSEPRLDRRAALERLQREEFDLLVVGGGVVGCGTALDAAARGLTVGLVERDDFASGTSSRSSKLVHGGLRYLERLDLTLVREALHERAALLRLAPHLVRPLRFLYPLRGERERLYVGAGLTLYDRLAGRDRVLPAHRRLSRSASNDVAADLVAPAGAFEYWDCEVDDARLTIALARTAVALGAACASRAEVVSLDRDGGRWRARLADRARGGELEVRARRVIGACGVWTEQLAGLAGVESPLRLTPSKGAHVVLPRDAFATGAAVISRTRDSVLLVVPWGAHLIVGTTDTPWSGDVEPVATDGEVDYLVGELNRISTRTVSSTQVVATYAGLRPLLGEARRATSRVSREHAVATVAPGLTLVAGGKLTTYRLMARDAVDAALGARSRPAEVPLVGARGFAEAWGARTELAERHRLPRAEIERLLHRYGAALDAVLAPAADDPSLLEPLPGAPEYLRAEALFAVTHEGSVTADDVLERRTHAALESPAGVAEAGAAVAPLLEL
jgi:glycerol-3-phosphate dehydrogenase